MFRIYFFILVTGIFWIGCSKESDMYYLAQGINKIQSYQKYLNAYPDGQFSEKVIFKVDSLYREHKILLDSGKIAYKKSKYHEAVKILESANTIYNNDQETHYFLAYSYERSNYDCASKIYKASVRLNEKASLHLEKVIQINPRYLGELIILDPYSKLTSIWGALAYKFLANSQLDSAIWCLKQGKARGGYYESLLEYNRNVLKSCEPNALLFTNGDMDTFPMLYIQFVEHFRTDVSVINLDLLKTRWYIHYITDNLKVPLSLSKEKTYYPSYIPWEKTAISLDVIDSISNADYYEFKSTYPSRKIKKVKKITFEVVPTYKGIKNNFLRSQDLLLLNILKENKWKRPVYFASTVPNKNIISGLAAYFRLDGLASKLTPYKNWFISPNLSDSLLFRAFSYKGLNDIVFTYVDKIGELYNNYRLTSILLQEYYILIKQDSTKLHRIVEFQNSFWPTEKVPIKNHRTAILIAAIELSLNPSHQDSILGKYNVSIDSDTLGEFLFRYKKPNLAIRFLEKAYKKDPGNRHVVEILLTAYGMTKANKKAKEILEAFVKLNPKDQNAYRFLQHLRKKNE